MVGGVDADFDGAGAVGLGLAEVALGPGAVSVAVDASGAGAPEGAGEAQPRSTTSAAPTAGRNQLDNATIVTAPSRPGGCTIFQSRAAAPVASGSKVPAAAAVGEVRGRLAVGVISTVAAVDVPAALREFHRRYPAVRISLRAAASDDLIDQVKDGTVEVAFLGLPATARPTGVHARLLARDRLVAVLAPDHPLAGQTRVALRRLAEEVFVDLPARTAGRAQSDQAFAAAGLVREVAFEVTTAYLTAGLVRQGLGIALLPSAYVPRLSGVVTVEVTDAPARAEYVIWGPGGGTAAATAFLDLLDAPSMTAAGESAARGSYPEPRS